MMHKIKITCDSTCDLTAELYEKYNVEVLPLGVSLGDEFYHDGVDVTAKSIFSFVEEKGVLPKTAAVSRLAASWAISLRWLRTAPMSPNRRNQ